ncbi:hypothetical protein [Desulfuromonas sp. CSMB_57]|jgi:hypothetical protein|uniref:hypothetical protein n=1 Tax=Desulfuromonas sp. CSMB_57 TaxID=2807629 RepID=UPI001CD53E00|nr:hypothetical protein [Desulfuromonas sp. CSMB_57]
MPVLVEAISIIVRMDAINMKYSGGWLGFMRGVPNQTLCFDDDLARIGFMASNEAEAYIRTLVQGGLTFMHEEQAIDIAVIDQIRGPLVPVKWLDFARVPLATPEQKVTACWLHHAPKGTVAPRPAPPMTLATPAGWQYEESLSANVRFVSADDLDENFKFLRHEPGVDVYLDVTTGQEVYVGRKRR